VTTVEDTGLKSGTSVTVTDTVRNLPSKKGVLICYQPVEPSPPPATLLPKCHGKHFVAACVKSLTEVKSVTEDTGSVVATLMLPAGDPRFHIGGVTPVVTSVRPTAPKAGKKLTIKGANLSEVTAVTVGGVSAKILSRALTSVKVDAPAGAHGVVVVTSLAGQARSAVVVSVSALTTHAGPARRHG
jgi:IPT/TIG domain